MKLELCIILKLFPKFCDSKFEYPEYPYKPYPYKKKVFIYFWERISERANKFLQMVICMKSLSLIPDIQVFDTRHTRKFFWVSLKRFFARVTPVAMFRT